MNKEAVLVTGGTGFIGRAVAAALRSKGRTVFAPGSAEGDIAEAASLASFSDAGIKSVVHCAGRTFVPDSWDDPAGFLRTNGLGTMRVLDFCRAAGARMVHISAYIYGRPQSLPIAETAPVNANNPYAHSKHLAEQCCRFYADHFGLPVTILRPFNIYGPGQAEKFLIPTILRQLRDGGTVEVLDLEPRRDYLLLADLVDAILRAEARQPTGCDTFNVGSGVSHSVAEIIAMAQAVAGTALPVASRAMTRNQEISDVVADIAAARAALGWAPRRSLGEGLAHCWQGLTAGQDNKKVAAKAASGALP